MFKFSHKQILHCLIACPRGLFCYNHAQIHGPQNRVLAGLLIAQNRTQPSDAHLARIETHPEWFFLCLVSVTVFLHGPNSSRQN